MQGQFLQKNRLKLTFIGYREEVVRLAGEGKLASSMVMVCGRRKGDGMVTRNKGSKWGAEGTYKWG